MPVQSYSMTTFDMKQQGKTQGKFGTGNFSNEHCSPQVEIWSNSSMCAECLMETLQSKEDLALSPILEDCSAERH